MTLLYYDPFFQEHRTGDHPERGERLSTAIKNLQFVGTFALCRRAPWESVSRERLTRVHAAGYVDELIQYCDAGGGWIESDTVVSPESARVAMRCAGAACDATQRVLLDEDRQALCLTRPPGHHALAAAPMGFCLFNHAAIAARTATDEFGVDRVLIVDWDVHHGNGTQQLFWEDGRVGYMSIHRWPFYPGTGAADETGSGDGLGKTLNVPVEFGTARDEYIQAFKHHLHAFADHLRPQLVIVSAGFDSHRADPVGSLGLETEDFKELTRIVQEVASVHSKGRLVSILEGGYNPEILSDCIEVHLDELLARDEAAPKL